MQNVCPLQLSWGDIVAIELPQSANTTWVDIQDNSEDIKTSVSIFASLNYGETFEPLSARFLSKAATSQNNVMLRFDASMLASNETYVIADISYGNSAANQNAQFAKPAKQTAYGKESKVRAIDEAALKAAVASNIDELGELAQDCNSWPVQYYPADILTRIDVLNAESLKAIRGSKTLHVFFPHSKVLGNLEFDSLGLVYDELTVLHVRPAEFKSVFGKERPNRNDVVWIGFLDQFFEVTDVQDFKTPINTIAYYELTMRFLTDRQSVAKDEGVLDLSSLIAATDTSGMYADKEPVADLKDFPKTKWSSQSFSMAKAVTLADSMTAYGICYDNGWKKAKLIEGTLHTCNLDGSNASEVAVQDDAIMYFAKFAEFSKPLSQFDETMYFSTPSLPSKLKPLELIELQSYA